MMAHTKAISLYQKYFKQSISVNIWDNVEALNHRKNRRHLKIITQQSFGNRRPWTTQNHLTWLYVLPKNKTMWSKNCRRPGLEKTKTVWSNILSLLFVLFLRPSPGVNCSTGTRRKSAVNAKSYKQQVFNQRGTHVNTTVMGGPLKKDQAEEKEKRSPEKLQWGSLIKTKKKTNIYTFSI